MTSLTDVGLSATATALLRWNLR